MARFDRDGMALWCAKRLPRWLRYWSVIKEFADATQGKYSGTVVPDLTVVELLKRIEIKSKPLSGYVPRVYDRNSIVPVGEVSSEAMAAGFGELRGHSIGNLLAEFYTGGEYIRRIGWPAGDHISADGAEGGTIWYYTDATDENEPGYRLDFHDLGARDWVVVDSPRFVKELPPEMRRE